MRDEWGRSPIRPFIITTAAVPLLFTILVLAVFGLEGDEWIPAALGLALIYAPIVFFLMYRRTELGELYRAQRRPIASGFSDARAHLERALVASGLPSKERPSRHPVDVATWDVRGGIIVKLFDGAGQCYVYVGPVNDGTRRSVEGLKRAIDAALPRAKR
jgi:hypothetical protein